MNKKNKILTIVAILIAGGAIFASLIFRTQPKVVLPPLISAQPHTVPSPGVNERPSGDAFDIPTDYGTVTVNNFYKQAVWVNDENHVLISSDPGYQIMYFGNGRSFAIALLDKPLSRNRDAAEKDFLEKLRITKEQACVLDLTLMIPFNLDPDRSGENYGLSFCPGGRSL